MGRTSSSLSHTTSGAPAFEATGRPALATHPDRKEHDEGTDWMAHKRREAGQLTAEPAIQERCGGGMDRRSCYALEQEPLYVDIAVRRWEAFSGARATRAKA